MKTLKDFRNISEATKAPTLPDKLRLAGSTAEIQMNQWMHEVKRLDPALGKKATKLYMDFSINRDKIQLELEKKISK